jgi:hypothetical protein
MRYIIFALGAFLVASFVMQPHPQLEFLILDVFQQLGREPRDPVHVQRILVPIVAAIGATMMLMGAAGAFRSK